MPQSGDEFTVDQAMQIENWYDIAQQYGEDPEWGITNNWHGGPQGGGAFEPRAIDWGYQDGFPVYAGLHIKGVKYHVYWKPKEDKYWIDPQLPG